MWWSRPRPPLRRCSSGSGSRLGYTSTRSVRHAQVLQEVRIKVGAVASCSWRIGARRGGTVTGSENNKQTVLDYYNMAFNDRKPAEAVEKYGGPYYTQHNPQAPDGFEAFIQFVTDFVEQFPQMSLDIKRAIAEGDLVATHSLLKTSPEDRGTALADIFR